MSSGLLALKKDPMGAAISDYYANGKSATLHLYSSQFDDDTFPVEHLFRTFDSMPTLEQVAIKQCIGRVLDVGGGAGAHALELQNLGLSVTSIDISQRSVDTMKSRGVYDARNVDFFDETFTEKYDTILLLMNGTGIVGTTERLNLFFNRISTLLNSGGKLLIDSSDLRYLYQEEDGSISIDLNSDYYGEIDFYMKYKNIKGDKFIWLYLDIETLQYYAEQNGFKTEIIFRGCENEYLALLKKI